MTRRAVLGGGVGLVAVAAGGLAGVESGVLPGRLRLDRALGRGRVDSPVPGGAGVPVRAGAFVSRHRGRSVRWMLAAPAGAAPARLPLVLVLHGYGDDARAAFGPLGLQHFLARQVSAGGPPLALLSVDGGNAYWHPRADGDDPLGMLTGELLPRMVAAGFRTGRLGAMGWSMGGYGALLLARESSQGRLSGLRLEAAAASSPALFPSAGATARGAFDDPADWSRYGDLAAHPRVHGVALTVSCGDVDPFAAETRRYRSHNVPTPAGGITSGRHEFGYWRSLVPAQLRFLGEHLST